MQKFRVVVFDGEHQLWVSEVEPPLEIGRKQDGDSSDLELQNHQAYRRLVMAPSSARSIPRLAIRVESVDSSQFRIVNMHKWLPFAIAGGEPLPPGNVYLSRNATRVMLPEGRAVEVSVVHDVAFMEPSHLSDTSNFRTISFDATEEENVAPAKLRSVLTGDHEASRGRAAVDLVRSALEVVRQSAGSDQFFDAACSAAVEMVDLDRVMVLLSEGGSWRQRAIKTMNGAEREDSSVASFSDRLVSRVMRTCKTAIYDPTNSLAMHGDSLMLLELAVASPITDESGKPIGVLYGDRELGGAVGLMPIGEMEAALFEVLASAVSSGLARQREEQRRAALTQFFSPRIAEQLENNHNLLTGQHAEVTVLFCDVRGFSAVAERVGPQRTIEWINDVLTELSLCVMRHDGVLVDYVGDELMAMWGAPGEQLDHAQRACSAACEMLQTIAPLRDRWRDLTPEGFGIGIGINTGMAQVGNTGSRIKFKYGPLGNVVNVASRIQGVTKQIGVRALISASTAQSVDSEQFDIRKLCTVGVVGIQEPITILQLAYQESSNWQKMKNMYESSLGYFERGDLSTAAQNLAMLVHEFPDDQPSLILLGRVVDALTTKSKPADAVWRLRNK